MIMIKSLSLNINKDHTKSLALTIILYYGMVNGAIIGLFNFNSIDLLLFVVEGGIIALSMVYVLEDIPTQMILLYFFVLSVFLISVLFFPENQLILWNNARSLFLFCIPTCCLIVSIRDTNYLWNLLCIGAYVTILSGLIFDITLYSKTAIEGGYSMWFGYQMTIPTMIALWRWFNKKGRIMAFIMASIGLFLIIMRGSRAPILIIVIYIFICIVYYVVKIENGSKGKGPFKATMRIGRNNYSVVRLAILVLLTIATVYVLLNIEDIAGQLYVYFLSKGQDIRTFRVLSMKNALQYVSGRDQIYSISIELIKKHPLIGYGMGGDCIQIASQLGKSASEASGLYAHNLILELVLNYGVPVGALLSIAYYGLVIKKMYILRNKDEVQSLYLIIAVVGITVSLLSANYLDAPVLWLLLGMAIKKPRARMGELDGVL